MRCFRYLVLCSAGYMVFMQSCTIDPCGSAPADLIENMEDLVKEASTVDYQPDADEWKRYDDRFKVFYEECYEMWRPEMTIGQKSEFAGLVTRYVANRFGRSFFRSIFGGNQDRQNETEEFLDNLGKGLEDFLEQNTDWLEK